MTKLTKLITICFAAALLAVSAFSSTALAASEIYSSTNRVINNSVVGTLESVDISSNTIDGSSGDSVIIDEKYDIIDNSVLGQYTDISERVNIIKGKGSKGSKAIVSTDDFIMDDSVGGIVNKYSSRYNYIGN